MTKASDTALAQARQVAEYHNRISSSNGDTGRDSVIRLDANETNMLALALEQMRSRVYEDEFAIQKARLYIPATGEVGNAAESFAYEETTEYGEAEIISNYADDLPTVETSGRKVTHKVLGFGTSYAYSMQDIRRAAFSGKPLQARKAIAARRAWERKLDEIAAVGAPTAGIPTGMLNNASVAIEAPATAGVWAGKGAKEMSDDLTKLVTEMMVQTKELYMPNRVLLPFAQWRRLTTERYSIETPETGMDAFLKANPFITSVDPWNKLEGAGAGGVNRAVAYTFDPQIVELVIPQEFEVLPPQTKNFAFQVLCHGRTGGTVVYRPLGMRYLDGI